MVGGLPTSLTINGKEYAINSDYRVALLILQCYTDEELTDFEKIIVIIKCLYIEDIPEEYWNEALEQANWYFNCGNTVSSPVSTKPLYDWEQDEQMIFSAINKIAGKEIRAVEYLHYWTFIGFFNEIGEGVFSTVLNIRNKKAKHKKLEKWENEFYRNNKEIVDIKRKYTKSEKSDLLALDELLGI